jgi:signal peptidase I
VVEVGVTLVLAFLLYLGITTFLVGTFRVENVSMQPTLVEGQHLLVDKLTPRFDSYSRGDIVVFQEPGADPGAIPFIKRVIGEPGDHLELRDGQVIIDDVALVEPYRSDDGPGDGGTFPQRGVSSWDIPEGAVFVMGDHRAHSEDSRTFGVVTVDRIIGRAVVRFWPLDVAGIVQTPTYPELDGSGERSADP